MLKTDIIFEIISDVIEIARMKKVGFFVTVDIKKHDSLDQNFLVTTLESGAVCS